jgi:hypothetical protein
MRSCATRVENLNGPTHTGLVANLSSPALSAAGDMIMPARSASTAVSGTNAVFRWMVTVIGSVASTEATLDSSVLRADPDSVMCRFRLVCTAAASKGVPSANFTPLRTLIVTVFPSAENSGSAAASCGTTSSLAPTS